MSADDESWRAEFRAALLLRSSHPLLRLKHVFSRLTVDDVRMVYSSCHAHSMTFLVEFYQQRLICNTDADVARMLPDEPEFAWWYAVFSGCSIDGLCALLHACAASHGYRWLLRRYRQMAYPGTDIIGIVRYCIVAAAMRMDVRARGQRAMLRLFARVLQERTIRIDSTREIRNRYAGRIIFRLFTEIADGVVFSSDTLSATACTEFATDVDFRELLSAGVGLDAVVQHMHRTEDSLRWVRPLVCFALDHPTATLREIRDAIGIPTVAHANEAAVWRLDMDPAPADGAFHRARALLGWRPDRHRWASAPCREQLAAVLSLARPTPTTALRLASAFFGAHMLRVPPDT